MLANNLYSQLVKLSVVKDPLADNTAQGSVLVLIKFSGNNPKAEDSLVSQQAGKRSIIQQSNRVQGRSIQNTESHRVRSKIRQRVKITGRQSIVCQNML